MPTWTGRLVRLHHYLTAHAVYASVLASGLAIVLLAGRVIRSQSLTYTFLVWNLFLAWIPYLSSLWADRLDASSSSSRLRLAVPALLWLAFFPMLPTSLPTSGTCRRGNPCRCGTMPAYSQFLP